MNICKGNFLPDSDRFRQIVFPVFHDNNTITLTTIIP